MAKLKIVSVKDRALDAFGRPFYLPTIASAERSFTDEVNNKESTIYAHPEDYDLFLLGEFVEETGQFECLALPQLICRAQDVKRP